MRRRILGILSIASVLPLLMLNCDFIHRLPSGPIINHECTGLAGIPVEAISVAKNTLHIAYGHTSHGSQLIDGMTGLAGWKGALYSWNNGGTGGALDVRDTPFSGASDLGNPDFTSWETATRSYLSNPANSAINVVIWSWCGEASNAGEAQITNYLALMSGLETSYPNVKFVYMTGHLDGTGLAGNLYQRNEQIRAYCRTNNKWLYDFADIESFDPDAQVNYMIRMANDACNWDKNNNGSTEADGSGNPINGDANWAIDWQNAHTVNVDWYNCGSAHSQPLNANRKAYAAWWLWARLAGWNP